ncbi:MAG: hypothetical protein JST00_37480 [Deltaproteobacteria bacterium]|nr:hypothetical protein [Deltaproteobacteria bacterium]
MLSARRILLFVGLSLSAGLTGACSDDPIARAEAAQRRTEIRQAKLRAAQCESSIEIYPPGMRPNRPFRVLGPVDGTWGFTVESRFQRMRRKACEMGATALLDAEERNDVVVESTREITRYDAYGRPYTVVEQPQHSVRRTSALAVVFTDGQ